MKRKKRIGILSSGQISPGINAAVRAVARTIFLAGHEVINIENGFDGLLNRENISLPHWSFFRGMLFKGGTVLGLPQFGDPFNYPYIRGTSISYIDKSQTVLDMIDDFKIETLIVIGGFNDIEISRKFSQMGVRIILIPNIITNDLDKVEYTFGYTTAIQTASSALDKLHSTAESHHRVFLVEVIGEHSGWIALEAGITGGSDVILIPELPFSIDKIIQTLEDRKETGAEFSLIVAASGARPASGNYNPETEMIINYLHAAMKDKIDLELRDISLKLIQRGGSPMAYDRLLATYYGYEAAKYALKNDEKSYLIAKDEKFNAYPIDKFEVKYRKIPENHLIISSAESVGISLCYD